jgi:F420-dependent oxidoreductase-like protein
MTTFGLQLPDFAWITCDPTNTTAKLRQCALAAESSGYSSLWVMDHFFQLPPLGGAQAPMIEAYTLLGLLAGMTEQIRLGALVTGVTYRNPAMLAKQITSLDILSGGRAIAGIGAAWHDIEHHAFGFDFPPLKERFARLEEAVAIMRGMFREEAPSFSGNYYRIAEARNVPAPIQPGGPELMIGGSGEQKTLRIVARLADSCNVSGNAATVRRLMDLLDSHCAEVDRDPSTLRRTRLGSMFLCATDEQVKGTKDFLQAVGVDASPMVIGTRNACVAMVRELVEAGLDDVIFNIPQMSSADQISAVGAVLAEACAS